MVGEAVQQSLSDPEDLGPLFTRLTVRSSCGRLDCRTGQGLITGRG